MKITEEDAKYYELNSFLTNEHYECQV